MATEMLVPLLGESVRQATLVTWLKKEGDAVKRGEEIANVETDKATVALECPATGVLLRIFIPEGSTIVSGQALALIGNPGESVEAMHHQLDQKPVPGAAEHQSVEEIRAKPDMSMQQERISPAARRMAKKLGIRLSDLQPPASGRRIMIEDIERAYQSKQDFTMAPEGNFHSSNTSQAGAQLANAEDDVRAVPGHRVPLTQLRKHTGQRMLESVRSIPQFSVTMEANADRLLELKETINRDVKTPAEKTSLTAMLIHLVVHALQRHPHLNATFDQESLWVYNTVNIAVAIATPNGLVAPVLHAVEFMDVHGIMRQLNLLTATARASQLSISDLSGGTFTFSNLGMFGVTQFTPIVNPPQVAILGVGCVRPGLAPSPAGGITPLSLISLTVTADHRAVDGVEVAEFLGDLCNLIGNCSDLFDAC
jgi:pyruvate dehydrogenase E2 component (dihydrolipoamide acetyltransferase)